MFEKTLHRSLFIKNILWPVLIDHKLEVVISVRRAGETIAWRLSGLLDLLKLYLQSATVEANCLDGNNKTPRDICCLAQLFGYGEYA